MQTLTNQIQITYDVSGRPASVIVPFNLFKKLVPPRDVKTILKESSEIAKKSGVTLKELLSTLKEVRKERVRQYLL